VLGSIVIHHLLLLQELIFWKKINILRMENSHRQDVAMKIAENRKVAKYR
jgi:hypothetical protein